MKNNTRQHVPPCDGYKLHLLGWLNVKGRPTTDRQGDKGQILQCDTIWDGEFVARLARLHESFPEHQYDALILDAFGYHLPFLCSFLLVFISPLRDIELLAFRQASGEGVTKWDGKEGGSNPFMC